MRRFGVSFATLVLVAAQLAFAGVAVAGDPSRFSATPLSADSTFTAPKSASGALAKTDPSLLGRTDSKRVNVLVKYDVDAVASYAGGVAGLAATSPRATGKSLEANRGAVAAYARWATSEAKSISAAAQKAVDGLTIRGTYTTAYGGVAASVPANQIGKLLRTPGVAAVQKDSIQQPQDDNTDFIGATDVWPSLGGQDNAGSNVIVGLLDTGVWPESPFFVDRGLPTPASTPACEFGDGSDAAHLGPAFACNNKLLGAYAFLDTYLALVGSDGHEFCNDTTKVCSARDSEGHGTHTASTAAGSRVDSAMLYGVERGPVSGIAPGAHVIEYRVCMSQGCFSSDSVAAVNQAIADGVNVINFSISGGAQPYTDPVELAFLDATNAGISVNASAGNSGPGAGTSDHAGPWVTTVGASTGPRFFTSTLHLAADGGATFDMSGVTVTNGISTPTPVVLAETLPGEDVLCQSPLAAGTATGKIVACERGTNARVDKGFNVLQGGAAGMILYNPTKMDVETDNHWLPAIHVDGPDTDLLDFINGHTNVTATWVQGTATPTRPDVMASFSSRGPSGDWIKPDVTAPGIQVLAGMTPQPDETTPTNGPTGNLFQAIAGTSMSSPHAAGVSALVKAAHPSWTPEEIKSALMTSSVQDVVKEDGTTPADPFDMGAGSIRADRAVNPTLVFNETAADFAAVAADPLRRIDINIPSVNAPTMLGSITTERTAINVSGRNQVFKVKTVAPAGASIKVGRNDGNLSVKAGKSLTFSITINGRALAAGQYFGRITLTPQGGGNAVTIPVAFKKVDTAAGAVSLTHACAPTAFEHGESATCTVAVANFAPVDADVDVTVSGTNGLRYSNASPPARLVKSNKGVAWSGTLTPALPPQVASIAPVDRIGGYLPLSAFNIAPVAGVADDSISNFDVPTFYYGGEPYSRIGVVSNGYVVVGGGDSGDIVFDPQTFPNPNRPNNVVAPLWNDLNPSATGAGAIRVATLTDGASTWLVVDYDGVKNFSNATTHTMELWFRLASGAAGSGPESEEVTITYGAANTASPDPGSGGNSGAENRDGSSGQNLTTPADNTEWAVNLTGPTAGGTATFTYDATAGPGVYDSIARMTSNVTPGTSEATQRLIVAP
ncbi:MAG TPA: S8 family serine peptidase [Candidatus Limnocylindrales bacterium]|nr:S8 family serine peptidase [Candidatus Limnocylindrales bacterium]